MALFAAIDVGTNSVLLLVGEVLAGGEVRPIRDLMRVTRLGEELGRTGRIAEAAAARTLAALAEYRGICAELGVVRTVAAGTAALRRAANAGGFLAAAKEHAGLDIDVISEEREAALSFAASARSFGSDIVVCDIGGGSTELSGPGPDGALAFESLPLGCVALTERFLPAAPETNEQIFHLRREVRDILERDADPALFARPHDRAFVATAGTATTLMAMQLGLSPYDPARIHGQRLSLEMLRTLIDRMRPMTLDERRRIPGLIPERADVILAGAELLQEIMSWLGYADAAVSDRGVRWGLFYEAFCS